MEEEVLKLVIASTFPGRGAARKSAFTRVNARLLVHR
jgi:hypothetical protein